MIRLLIAEDEYIVRRGIVSSIDWESLGIEVCGEAENGVQALEMAKRLKPHIVLTDIRMPVMDGLEFVSNLKISQPNVRVIVFSGYDDFNYALRAIRLGVNEYLLKPINIDELIRVITEQKNCIVEGLRQFSKQYQVDLLYSQKLPYIQFNYLMKLFSSVSIDSETLALAVSFGINLQGPEYKVIVADIDDYIFQDEHWTENERETMKSAIMNIIDDVFSGMWKPVICYGKGCNIIILLSGHEIQDSTVESFCRQILGFVRKYMSISLTIGIGSTCSTVDELGRSYNEARLAIRNKTVSGKNKIYKYSDINDENKHVSSVITCGYKKDLIAAIKKFDMDAVKAALERILSRFDDNILYFEMVKAECVKLLISVASVIEDIGINVNSAYNGYFNPVEEIAGFETVEECTNYARNETLKLVGLVLKEKNENYKAIVKKTIEYIKENYMKDITLEQVARELFITPSYLSRVFKQETNMNFVAWVNKYRVNKAKELLKDMSLKIYHVAEMVGYNDYRYFNINFKKYTGFTAKEYRDMLAANNENNLS